MPKQLALAEIKIGERFRKELGDIAGLAESIATDGLLHPVVVDSENRLVAGRRRIEAVKQLGWPKVPVTVVNLEDIRRGEVAENTERLDFTDSEKVAVANAGLANEQAAAKERQREGGRTKEASVNFSEASAEREAKQRVARAVGWSRPTYEKAKAIVDSGDEALVAKMDRTGNISGCHKELLVKTQKAEIAERKPAPLEGPFSVIIADPPWQFHLPTAHRGAPGYATMGLEEVCGYLGERGVPLKDDAVLWLWTTNLDLPGAFRVVEAWGFEYRTCLTWGKQKWGTGNYLRGQTEHCLLGTRGEPFIDGASTGTLLLAGAGKHSAKPDEFYELVRKVSPFAENEAIELFQRVPRAGMVGDGLEAQVGTECAAS